eukprot:gene5289-10581_t
MVIQSSNETGKGRTPPINRGFDGFVGITISGGTLWNLGDISVAVEALGKALCLSSDLYLRKNHQMQKIRNDGQGGRGVVLMPRNGQYSKVIFWFHGLGDDASGWSETMPVFGMQDTKFILPTAETRPISLNGGSPMPGWSDIYALDITSKEDREGFDSSAERIKRMIQREIDGGISPSKIILGGFSQGGALALHMSLRSEFPLGGCVALSSWLPLRADYPAALSSNATALPILQVHGDADGVVDLPWGAGSHSLLKELISSPVPIFEIIKGMGHSSSNSELQMVSEFLKHLIWIIFYSYAALSVQHSNLHAVPATSLVFPDAISQAIVVSTPYISKF